MFIVFFESQGKNNKTAKKQKTIALAHATITCLVINTRKYVRFFLGVFFGFCFWALPNLTT